MSGECGSFLHASFLVMASHARQVQQDGETCRALHQGADRGTFKTYDEVPFPVARHGSIGCLCRTLADHDLGRNEGPAWPARAHPRHPQRPPGAQAGRQFTAQGSSTLHIKRLIDRLVTDAHHLILGKVEPKATRDRAWRAIEQPSDGSYTVSLRAQDGYLLTFGERKVAP